MGLSGRYRAGTVVRNVALLSVAVLAALVRPSAGLYRDGYPPSLPNILCGGSARDCFFHDQLGHSGMSLRIERTGQV